jgi:hypothetical protein
MDRYDLKSRTLGRVKSSNEAVHTKLQNKFNHKLSRYNAHRLRNEVVKFRKGKQIVDRKLKKQIKDYSSDRFGTPDYWPWLAYYTEMRGEFLEGWLPVDYYRFSLLPKWNQLSEVSLFKSFDYQLFGDFAVKPIAVKVSGIWYDSEFEPLSENNLSEKLKECGREVVVKTDGGRGGYDTKFVKIEEFNPDQLSKNLNYVLQPAITQHKVMNMFSGNSVNTIRIITVRDENGDFLPVLTYLRFGRGESRVDNTSSGGLYANLDTSGDICTDAFQGIGLIKEEIHPEGGFPYRGIKIPGYDEAIENCIGAHKKFPYTKIIGWDVCVDATGEVRLLEWNARRPLIWVLEPLFGPRFKGLF